MALGVEFNILYQCSLTLTEVGGDARLFLMQPETVRELTHPLIKYLPNIQSREPPEIQPG